MKLGGLLVLAVVAVLYWLMERIGVSARQALVKWIARKQLELVYVKVLAWGREATILESMQLPKRPYHICLSIQPVRSI
jgi:hypothetical protein